MIFIFCFAHIVNIDYLRILTQLAVCSAVTRPHPIGATPLGESVTVADTPVKDTDVKVDIVTLPTEDVAESPVSGTPIPITTDQTEEVAETPVG